MAFVTNDPVVIPPSADERPLIPSIHLVPFVQRICRVRNLCKRKAVSVEALNRFCEMMLRSTLDLTRCSWTQKVAQFGVLRTRARTAQHKDVNALK